MEDVEPLAAQDFQGEALRDPRREAEDPGHGGMARGADRECPAQREAGAQRRTRPAGDATPSVAAPSPNAPVRLVNGTFTLASPIPAPATTTANPSTAFAPVTSSANPLVLLTYPGPVSLDPVTIDLSEPEVTNTVISLGR